jgi:hypothetical protein
VLITHRSLLYQIEEKVMPAGLWFWVIYILIGIFGGWWGFSNSGDRRWIGGGFVIFVLIGLLGWGIFGPPIR